MADFDFMGYLAALREGRHRGAAALRQPNGLLGTGPSAEAGSEQTRRWYCTRRDCRFYNEPHKGAPHSCDYLAMTGRSRIAQIPDEEARLDFARCPCYERAARRSEERTAQRYEQRAAYDWGEGRRRYINGESDAQIAAALGCARSTVKYWRRRMRLPANAAGKGR